MTDLQTEKRNRAYKFLIFATFFLYIILTGSKNLYVAEKTTLQSLGTFGSFTDLAATLEYYFYAYAVMQILLVFFMKKMNIKWFLTITLGISALITVLVAFTDTILSHWILYTANGVMQAGVWGCSIKTLSVYLPQRYLSTANKLMTSGPAVAGAIAYGTAALFGEDWTTPFIVLGVILMISILLFFISVTKVHGYPREEEVETPTAVKSESDNDFIHLDNKTRKIVFYVISVLMGAIVTSLFFAMNNTLDIFLKQIGGFDNTSAKWTTVLAPLAFTLGPILCVNACDKQRNFILVGLLFFGLSFLFSILLYFFFDTNIVLSMALLLVYLVLTNGGRSISLSIASLKLRNKIDAGIYSTLVNVAASVASGVIPKLFTAIVDNTAVSAIENWSNAFFVLILANATVVLALSLLIVWIKRLNKKDEKRANL